MSHDAAEGLRFSGASRATDWQRSPRAPIWSPPDVTSEAHLESLACQNRRFRVPAQPGAPYAVHRWSIHQARA